MIQFAKRHTNVLMYIIFGVSTTAINYVVFVLCCDFFDMSASKSNIIAWIVAVLFAFLTNKPFVFKSKDWSRRVVIPEFVKFVSSRIVSGVAETLFLFLTVDCMKWDGMLLKLIASGFVMVLNYLASKWFAFKE